MIGGLLIEILALIGYQFITAPIPLLLLRTLSGIAFYAVILSALARINDTIDDKHRGKTSGLFHTIISTAVITAPLLGGYIADTYGYANLFDVALYTMISILAGIFIHDLFLYDDKKEPHRKKTKLQKKDFNPYHDVKEALKHKEFKAIAFAGICANFTLPFTILLLPYFIIEQMSLSNTHLSIATFLIGFAHLFQYGLGNFSDNFGKGKSILLGLLISGIGLIAMAFTHTYWLLLVFILIKSFGGSLWNVSAWSYLSDVGEKYDIEGKLVGSFTSLSRIAAMTSNLLAGVLLVAMGQSLYLIYGIVILLPLLVVKNVLVGGVKKKKKPVAVKNRNKKTTTPI